MNKRTLTLALIVAWIALCAWSFLSYQLTAPSDFGFTRGLNRVSNFLEIQLLAVLVAAFAVTIAVIIWNEPAPSAPATSPPVTEPANP